MSISNQILAMKDLGQAPSTPGQDSIHAWNIFLRELKFFGKVLLVQDFVMWLISLGGNGGELGLAVMVAFGFVLYLVINVGILLWRYFIISGRQAGSGMAVISGLILMAINLTVLMKIAEGIRSGAGALVIMIIVGVLVAVVGYGWLVWARTNARKLIVLSGSAFLALLSFVTYLGLSGYISIGRP